MKKSEIRDYDDDELSLEGDSDDKLLKELGEHLDEKEKTAEKVAESMADILSRSSTSYCKTDGRQTH